MTAVNENLPIGSVVAFAGKTDKIPDNWLVCDGRELKKDDVLFKELFKRIEYTWGGDGGAHFNLPDFKGMFLRGVDRYQIGHASEPANDPDRELRKNKHGEVGNIIGSYQEDKFQSHYHKLWVGNQFSPAGGSKYAKVNEATDDAKTPLSGVIEPTTGDYGSETRPINAAVYWIIKAR